MLSCGGIYGNEVELSTEDHIFFEENLSQNTTRQIEEPYTYDVHFRANGNH